MQCEYEALLKQKTWDLVSLHPGRKMIGWKWVFRVKENVDGSINKNKVRLVAKGFHQIHGFDFHETFSPVIKSVTIRVILTDVVSHRWKLFHLVVNNVFLNGILDETVYMQQPPTFEASDQSLVCKLNKALYGLKQAPRQCFTRLQHTLQQLGFVSSSCDTSLFIDQHKSDVIYLLVYVNDILVIGSSLSLIQIITAKLHANFSLKQLGQLDYFLGL